MGFPWHNGYCLWNYTKYSIELSCDVIFERDFHALKLVESQRAVDFKEEYDEEESKSVFDNFS
jgi:hypothetical protein